MKRSLIYIASLSLLLFTSSLGGYAYLTRSVNKISEQVIHAFDMTEGLSEVSQVEIADPDFAGLPDGVYFGVFHGYRWSNSVEVTVEDQRIVGIMQLQTQRVHCDELIETLTARVIRAQSLDIDVVTNATVTSTTFLKAVENALASGRNGCDIR